MSSARYPRLLGVALLVWGGIVLFCAFAVICVHTATIWPWTKIVHEDGRHTLIGTILYFEHATRELPLDVILGVAIGGCVFFAFPPAPSAHGAEQAASTRRVLTLALITVIVITIILVGTAARGGMALVFDELLQNRTRFGVPLEFGSHWRYHLLERIAMILCSVGIAGLLRTLGPGYSALNGRPGLNIAGAAIGIYVALTFVFSHGRMFFELEQPFRDPQYLGHQAREVLTHALVTVPVAWGVCILLLSNRKTSFSAKSTSWNLPPPPAIAVTVMAGISGVVLATYVCVAALMAGAVSHGQTTDPVTLIFPHFFEHSFTYVLVSVVAALTYAVAAKSTVPR
jgi:hypothetical protein